MSGWLEGLVALLPAGVARAIYYPLALAAGGLAAAVAGLVVGIPALRLGLARPWEVAAALQDSAEQPDPGWPLGLLHRPGSAIRWLAEPAGGWGRFRGYCGSAAVDAAGGLLAMSSPRGNCVALWDAAGAAFATRAAAPACSWRAAASR